MPQYNNVWKNASIFTYGHAQCPNPTILLLSREVHPSVLWTTVTVPEVLHSSEVGLHLPNTHTHTHTKKQNLINNTCFNLCGRVHASALLNTWWNQVSDGLCMFFCKQSLSMSTSNKASCLNTVDRTGSVGARKNVLNPSN